MIARMWRGRTRASDADAYTRYVHETGIKDYLATEGNRGAWLLTRKLGEEVEFLTLSYWDAFDSIRAFAGDDVERARYYDEDRTYLLELVPTVEHFEIDDGS